MRDDVSDIHRPPLVVITTHSMEEASALSDRVAILAGKLLGVSVDAGWPEYTAYLDRGHHSRIHSHRHG